MPVQISKSSDDVGGALRDAIVAVLPDARVQVTPSSPGHFEIEVVSPAFAGKSMLQQQQLVYGAIKELMSGTGAPVHAIDRLRTKTP